jgi:hypothetical protein
MADGSIRPDTVQAQYIAYMADLGNMGARYSTSQAFYMSVVSGLVGIFAFVAKDGALSGHVAFVTVAVLAVIALICWAWWSTLSFYHDSFAAKLAVLKKMEEAATLFPIFKTEWAELSRNAVNAPATARSTDAQHRRSKELVNTERLVPAVIGGFAAIGALLVIIVVWVLPVTHAR